MIDFLKENIRKIVIIACAVVMGVGAILVVVEATEPTAAYADGTEVSRPYVVMAGDTELAVVEDEETGQRVIADLVEEYTPDSSQINEISTDKQISVKYKKLSRKEGDVTVLSEEDAVESILEENDSDDPVFTVTITADLGTIEEVKADKKYEKTDSLYEGDSKVKSEGTSGSQVVTEEVTAVNGSILTSQVVSMTVLTEGESTVIYKGTKEMPSVTSVYDLTDQSGQVVASDSSIGTKIAQYACKYVGLPYVWGGSSLETGADCGGFVMAIFAKFGYSVPRGSYSSGTRISSMSSAKPGDLVVYSGHVGIYIGGGKIVHERGRGYGCCISSINLCGSYRIYRVI